LSCFLELARILSSRFFRLTCQALETFLVKLWLYDARRTLVLTCNEEGSRYLIVFGCRRDWAGLLSFEGGEKDSLLHYLNLGRDESSGSTSREASLSTLIA
jgi:hypothetical protein